MHLPLLMTNIKFKINKKTIKEEIWLQVNKIIMNISKVNLGTIRINMDLKKINIKPNHVITQLRKMRSIKN